jgi:site-specific recombinase XerD
MKKKHDPNLALLLQKFFLERLLKQRNASPHTIKSYRDSFRLLLQFAQERLGKPPSSMEFCEIDAPLISAFLEKLEGNRRLAPRSRNLRLTAIKSFFKYAALEVPSHSLQIQRVLAIPGKRFEKRIIHFLTHEEVKAILSVADQGTWIGKRDYTLLLLAVHTGLRVSELTQLRLKDVFIGPAGAHVRVLGKGRKERSTPLTKQTVAVLKSWLNELSSDPERPLFPSLQGCHLSSDAIQYLLAKYTTKASKHCPSLLQKRVTPHCLRHTMAMELLFAGVDRSLIALWLGHESIETTQMYLQANLELKEKLLEKTRLVEGQVGRFEPNDQLLAFLTKL